MNHRPESSDGIETGLKSCGIQATHSDSGWRLISDSHRFDPFTVADSICWWDRGEGSIGSGRRAAVLCNTALRISFRGGSVLAAYANGLIRWIPEKGLRCFAAMTAGEIPVACQGDLVVYRLPDDGLPGCLHEVAAVLPEDTGQIWCACSIPRQDPVGVWRETAALPVGGNRRHMALGRFRYRFLWPADHRTIQIRTLAPTSLEHDPVDAVHPTLSLPSGEDFLVTKLPGFSNPAAEMRPVPETLR